MGGKYWGCVFSTFWVGLVRTWVFLPSTTQKVEKMHVEKFHGNSGQVRTCRFWVSFLGGGFLDFLGWTGQDMGILVHLGCGKVECGVRGLLLGRQVRRSGPVANLAESGGGAFFGLFGVDWSGHGYSIFKAK